MLQITNEDDGKRWCYEIKQPQQLLLHSEITSIVKIFTSY